MNILISGDFYISDDFRNKDLIDQSVIDLFQEADYRMVNLEAPITEDIPKNKILKTGPHLRMSEDTVMPYLKQLKIDAVTLANNHILDYGAKGLYETFESLKQNKIDYVGAGKSLGEAAQPLTLEKDGVRIAILNFCENEWSIAEADKPGANPMDIIDNTNQIKAAKATHDKVICIIHGGHEYYHLPSPRMQKQYRFYADNGADAIVGHHTHCIGGYEIYKDAPIIYSLGNFLFTKPSKKDVWYESLLCRLEIQKHKKIQFEIFPSLQKKKNFSVIIANSSTKQIVLKHHQKISTIISNGKLLNDSWEAFIQSSMNYLNFISPINAFSNRFVRAGLFKLRLSNLFTNKRFLNNLLNVIRCEAHSNIFISVLTKEIKKKNNAL